MRMLKIPDRTWKDLGPREREVVELAVDLIAWWRNAEQDRSRRKGAPWFTEAGIDSSFIFRFDPVWRPLAQNIQAMARKLLGQDEGVPLSAEDRTRCFNHLLANRGLHSEGRPDAPTIATDQILYHPLDPSLRQAVYDSLSVVVPLPDGEAAELQRRWVEEAELTHDMRIALYSLGVRFNVVSYVGPFEPFTSEIEDQLQRVACWALLERGCMPLFPWTMTKLEERKTGRSIERTIWPREWRAYKDGNLDARGGRMSPTVRIRAWAVYYLSKRGGGPWTEEGAVQIWAEIDDDSTRSTPAVWFQNYKEQRRRLFARGTKKA
jgi:hypothetical protein